LDLLQDNLLVTTTDWDRPHVPQHTAASATALDQQHTDNKTRQCRQPCLPPTQKTNTHALLLSSTTTVSQNQEVCPLHLRHVPSNHSHTFTVTRRLKRTQAYTKKIAQAPGW